MGSTLEQHEPDTERVVTTPESPAAEVRNRQVAASYLQASVLTDDPATRACLRRSAAALLMRRLGASECVAC
jgi:hypothetical protein